MGTYRRVGPRARTRAIVLTFVPDRHSLSRTFSSSGTHTKALDLFESALRLLGGQGGRQPGA